MKRSTQLVLFLGLIAGNTAMAQTICAGAEGSSKACAAPCSGTVVNDEVVANSNAGKFNVGNGNQGDANDGFNNVGSFNIGSGNSGNCNLVSGGTVGYCDVGNNNGRMAIRFCNVYPSDPKCRPGGYPSEFSPALQQQIASTVASCNGGPPVTPLAPLPPSSPVPPTAAPPTEPQPAAFNMARAPTVVPDSTISDSTFEPGKLLGLFLEHIEQEKAAGRKLLL